jgi:uncharacterized protein (TIGR03435 family)
MKREVSPVGVTMRSVSLGYCIRWAYDLKSYELVGPEWIDPPTDALYDISARAGSPAPEGQLKLMFRALLEERFALAVHREERQLPAYALLIAKNGPKLHRSASEGDAKFKPTGPYREQAENVSIARLVQYLDPPAGVSRPVVDMTGLVGSFDFTANVYHPRG